MRGQEMTLAGFKFSLYRNGQHSVLLTLFFLRRPPAVYDDKGVIEGLVK